MEKYIFCLIIIVSSLQAQQSRKKGPCLKIKPVERTLGTANKPDPGFYMESPRLPEDDVAEKEMIQRGKELQASAELIIATFNHDLKGIKKALAAGADINARSEKYGLTPLIIEASQPDSPAILRFLLQQPGIDVDAQDDNGST